MIEAKNLTKKYGELTALSGVSFEMKEGEVVGILGPNGAGKTTLLRILVSFLESDSGKVNIDGLEISKPLNQQKIKSKIGYLPENAPLYEDMSVTEYLKFVSQMQGAEKGDVEEKLSDVINKCGLKEKKNAEISTLSKGYRQRVGIAQALIHNPKIVILDEPTTGLDPNQRIEIRDLIKKIGKSKTVVLSSHVLSEVQATCSRIIIINKGKIVADGTPSELENSKRKGKAVINVEVEKADLQIGHKLRSMEGVSDVKIEGNNIFITADDRINLIKEISKAIANSGCGLLEFTRKQTDLEDIFISLTKGNE